MKRLLLLLALASAPLCAQMMTVSGSLVQDSTGILLVSGTIQFAPVDNFGRPISYKMPGGGQTLFRPVIAGVQNGVFTIQLPNTALTVPVNVCFAVTIKDQNGNSVLGVGYTCAQPSPASYWCSSNTCDWDNFNPNIPGLPVENAGGSGPVLQTNGVQNSNQSLLNFVDSSACAWTYSAGTIAVNCTGSGAGFPIHLGSTAIASGSTTAELDGLTVDAISPTIFGYLPNVTSDVQAQLNGKQATLGYAPAHNGANGDITSLSGLTTPLSPTQGGTGAAALAGYRYANGSSADTASTTIPMASVTGSLLHSQLPTLLSGDIPNNAANTSGSAGSLSSSSALPNGTTATTQTSADSTAKVATDAFVQAVISAAATLPFPGIVYATSATGGTVATGAQVAGAINGQAVTPASVNNVTTYSTSGNVLAVTHFNKAGTPALIEVFPDATDKPDEGNASVTGTTAWAAAQLSSGGEIFVHQGAYTVSTTITLGTAGTHLVCADPASTTFTAGASFNSDMFHIGFAGAQRQGMVVENCGFNGNNGSNTSGTILAVRDTANAIIANNYFQNAVTSGITLDATTSGMVQNQFAGNFFIECVNQCLIITDATGGHPTDSVIDRNTIGGSVIGNGTNPWVSVNEIGSLQFTNNHISGPGHTNAADFTSSSQSHVIISHNIMETINQDCLQITGTAFTVTGNSFYGCGQTTSNTYYSINMESSTNDTVTGNIFDGLTKTKSGVASSQAFLLNTIDGNAFQNMTGAAIVFANPFSGGNLVGSNGFNNNGGTVSDSGTHWGANPIPISTTVALGSVPGQLKTSGLATTQLATGSTPTITNAGTAGAATWTYVVVPKDINGNTAPASAAGSTTTGNATLSGSNYNVVTWTQTSGAYSYDVYRTAHGTSPATNGLIGNVLSTATLASNGAYFLNDTALSGNSATAPSVNTSGSGVFAGSISVGGLTQPAASTTGGTCAMAAGTSCTITLAHTYTTPVCMVTVQSGTVIAGGCTVSGTTVTITAASSNSSTWGAFVFGNPN